MEAILDTDELGRLPSALTEGRLTPSVDDSERIDRLRQFGSLKAAIAAAQMTEAAFKRVTGRAVADGADGADGELELVMTDDSLFGTSDEPATVPGYGPVPAPVARDLATRNTLTARWIRRLYLTPDVSQLMTMDSRRRTFGGNHARFIRLRDQGTCRTPWCDTTIRHLDHVEDWARSKHTSVVDGQGCCEACNYTKQANGRRTTGTADGTITPTGHRYTSGVPAPPGAREHSNDSPVEAQLRLRLRAA